MKKKIIPVLIAIVLIIVVFGIAFGGKIIDRYSYSKERADLNEIYAIRTRRIPQSFCRMKSLNRERSC